MKVKINYYIPVEMEVEMTAEEYCLFHASGEFQGRKIVPTQAIKEMVILDDESQEKLDEFLFKKFKKGLDK